MFDNIIIKILTRLKWIDKRVKKTTKLVEELQNKTEIINILFQYLKKIIKVLKKVVDIC